MDSEKIDKIEARKKEIEEELERIQGTLDDSVDDVKRDISNSLNPKRIIRENPLKALGASLLLGYLSGRSSSEKSNSNSVIDLVVSELKRDASKRVVKLIISYLENRASEIAPGASEGESRSNGVKER